MSDPILIVSQCDIFHGPVILVDISNILSWICITLDLLPAFHGAVILASILYTISQTCIILGVMVHSDSMIDLMSLLGHCDLYFTVH